MGSKAYHSTNERRLAWDVYVYFSANKQLLNEENGKQLFDAARKIMLDIYCAELGDSDEAAVEKALNMVAQHYAEKLIKI